MCFIVTQSLSAALSEILGPKHIGVTTLTFQARDVIVTIGLAMVHFLSVVLWTQVSISNDFRDIQPQTCAHRHNAKSSLRMRVSREMYPYVNFKYIFQFLTPTLPIHYVTFIELR